MFTVSVTRDNRTTVATLNEARARDAWSVIVIDSRVQVATLKNGEGKLVSSSGSFRVSL